MGAAQQQPHRAAAAGAASQPPAGSGGRVEASQPPAAANVWGPQAPDDGAGSTHDAEILLLQLFSVQSGLTDAQAAAVADRIGWTPEQVLSLHRDLYRSAERCIRHAKRRAAKAAAADGGAGGGAAAAGSGTAPSSGGTKKPRDAAAAAAAAAEAEAAQRALVASAAKEREAASGKLRQMLGEGGGLRDMTLAGQFVSLMAALPSSICRCQAAEAVAASRRSVLSKLVATAGFLTHLEQWLEGAQAMHHITLLKALLAALAALHLEASLLRSCPGLLRAVRHLRKHPHRAVSEAAVALHQRWHRLLAAMATAAAGTAGPGAAAAYGSGGGGGNFLSAAVSGSLPSARIGPTAAARPTADLPHAGLVQPTMRGYQALVASREAVSSDMTPNTQLRPLSADDIHKQRERERSQAQLAQLRQNQPPKQVKGAAGAVQDSALLPKSSVPPERQPGQQGQSGGHKRPAPSPPPPAAPLQQEEQPQPRPAKQAKREAGAGSASHRQQQVAQQQHQQQQDTQRHMSVQVEWRPPAEAAALAALHAAGHQIAAGEESTEAATRMDARRAAGVADEGARGRQQPSEQQGGEAEPTHLQEPDELTVVQERQGGRQPPELPYIPVAPKEQQEQEKLLRQAGWQPCT